MLEINFKKPEIEDKELITSLFKKYTSRNCERTFANTYLWSRKYPVTFAIVENTLVFKSESEDQMSFAFPAGEDEDVKRVIEILKQYQQENTTIVLITSSLEIALLSDYLYVINESKIMIEGNPIEIIEKDNIMNKAGLNLPFMIDLSVKLRDYELVNCIEQDKDRMVDLLWK